MKKHGTGLDLGGGTCRFAGVEQAEAGAKAAGLVSAWLLPPDGMPVVGDDAVLWRGRKSVKTLSAVKRQLAAVPNETTGAILRAFMIRLCRLMKESGLAQDEVVVAIPSYFSAAGRELLLEAGRSAGFDPLNGMPDVQAAALSFAKVNGFNGTAVVVGLGATAAEAAILQIEGNNIQEMSSAADLDLGGVCFDELLAGKVLEELEEGLRQEPVFREYVLAECEKAKFALSYRGSCDIRLEDKNRRVEYNRALSIYEWRDLTGDRIAVLRTLLTDLCDRAARPPQELDALFLYGGMSRIPWIRETIETLFDRKAAAHPCPDEAVVFGAALKCGA